MFSNYMENMSPFVKLKRARRRKKGRRWKGPFLLFRTHCSLSCRCLHSPPVNRHIRAADHFLNPTVKVKHLYKCLCHSKAFLRHLLRHCLYFFEIVWLVKQLEQSLVARVFLAETREPGNGSDHAFSPSSSLRSGWVPWPPMQRAEVLILTGSSDQGHKDP